MTTFVRFFRATLKVKAPCFNGARALTSIRQVLRIKIILLLVNRCNLDITPNSHDLPTKKFYGTSYENERFDFWNERVNY